MTKLFAQKNNFKLIPVFISIAHGHQTFRPRGEGVGGGGGDSTVIGLGCLLSPLGEQIKDLGPSLESPGQTDTNFSREYIFWVALADLEEIKKNAVVSISELSNKALATP